MTTERWVEWGEPRGDEGEVTYRPGLFLPVICRAKVADVIAFQRAKEPRYETDEQALDDFLVVYWATIKEYPVEQA